jgi:hypothetical protein
MAILSMRLPMSREGVEMNDWRENTGHAVIPSEISLETGEPKRVVDPARRANELSGKEWLRNSISVWSDITKSKEERSTKHPVVPGDDGGPLAGIVSEQAW